MGDVCYRSLKNKGFSLIELSVLLTVVATITVGYLNYIQPPTLTSAEKSIETLEKMRIIIQAIDTFRVQKERLPCPADGAVRVDNTRNAGEAVPPGPPSGYPWSFGEEMMASDDLDCEIPYGVIPTRALNLRSDFMYDGWGRRFTYRVSTILCNDIPALEEGCTSKEYRDESGGGSDLTITDEVPADITTAGAYVLLSHGSNGFGGYLPSGARLSVTGGSANEDENADDDITFVKAPYNPTAGASYFDDIVMYRTKDHIEAIVTDLLTPLVSQEDCSDNTALIGNLYPEEAEDLSHKIRSTRKDDQGDPVCDTGVDSTAGCYNTGDEAIIGYMMALQEACDTYTSISITPLCPGGEATTVNNGSFFNSDGNCECPSGDWSGTTGASSDPGSCNL